MTQGDIAQFTNNSSSNYCKMPDGTLICWGALTFASQATGKQRVAVTYPISFVETPCTTISWNDSQNVDGSFNYVWVANPTQHGFNACSNRISTVENWYARWTAIGRWK